MNTDPIGIFDSGSGGLSIWQEIVRQLPSESTLYIGDHSHLPYGEKTNAEIHIRAIRCLRFLSERKAKMMVVACNTATVAGIDLYRREFPSIPIVGVVPVIKTAQMMSKTKCFAVLSTDSTARSVYQKQLIRTFASDCRVISIGSSALVRRIEQGDVDSPDIRVLLDDILRPLKTVPADILVLGCTHFPFVRSAIEFVAGPSLTVLDSAPAVARQTARILAGERMHSDSDHPSHTFYTTGNPDAVRAVYSELLKRQTQVTKAEV